MNIQGQDPYSNTFFPKKKAKTNTANQTNKKDNIGLHSNIYR